MTSESDAAKVESSTTQLSGLDRLVDDLAAGSMSVDEFVDAASEVRTPDAPATDCTHCVDADSSHADDREAGEHGDECCYCGAAL